MDNTRKDRLLFKLGARPSLVKEGQVPFAPGGWFPRYPALDPKQKVETPQKPVSKSPPPESPPEITNEAQARAWLKQKYPNMPEGEIRKAIAPGGPPNVSLDLSAFEGKANPLRGQFDRTTALVRSLEKGKSRYRAAPGGLPTSAPSKRAPLKGEASPVRVKGAKPGIINTSGSKAQASPKAPVATNVDTSKVWNKAKDLVSRVAGYFTGTPKASPEGVQKFKIRSGQGYGHLASQINKQFKLKKDSRMTGSTLAKRMGRQILHGGKDYTFNPSQFTGEGLGADLSESGPLTGKKLLGSIALRKKLIAKGVFGKKPVPKPVTQKQAPVAPKTPLLGPKLTRESFGPPSVRPPPPTPEVNKALAAKRRTDMAAKGLGGPKGVPRSQMTAYRRDRSPTNRGVPVPAPLVMPRVMPK